MVNKKHEDKYIHVNKNAIKGILYMIPLIILCILIILGKIELSGEALVKFERAPCAAAALLISLISGFFALMILMFYGVAEIVNDE